jgi:hypothetical protein
MVMVEFYQSVATNSLIFKFSKLKDKLINIFNKKGLFSPKYFLYNGYG